MNLTREMLQKANQLIYNSLKHVLLSMLSLFIASTISAQSTLSQNQDGFNGNKMDGFINQAVQKDSTVVERNVSKDYSQFFIDPTLGTMIIIEPDTLSHLFQNNNMTNGQKGTYSYLGNLGSPRISRLYFEREASNDFIFDAPFDFFIKNPDQFRFTDTKSPHLNLTYNKAGDRNNGEERIKGYFVSNFNKKNGIGMDMDYLLGRGRYADQSTSMFDARFYAYHHGKSYSIHTSFNTDQLKIAENGGIEDKRYITNPEAMAEGKKQYAPEDIPFIMTSTWNNIKRRQLLLSQSLTLKGDFAVTDSIGDSTFTYNDRRDVSKISHTLEVSYLKRRYIYHEVPENYYQHDFLNDDGMDITDNILISNSINLSLLEGFSKWAVAGLSAYARYEFIQFSMPDTLSSGRSSEYIHKFREGNVFVGGLLERESGKNISFKIQAETVIAGEDIGDFNINGDINLTFPFLKENAVFGATTSIRNREPLFYQNKYHARDCWWDNKFDKELSTRIGGFIEINRLNTRISADIENISNYIYLIDNGTSTTLGTENTVLHNLQYLQNSGSIQIASATLNQDFALGPLYWDNSITYQISGDNDILPLPELNIFSDLYLKFNYAKRLRIELGANVSYFTEYAAPAYSPALGQYNMQNKNSEIKVGGYPLVNAYVNCSLRGVRFYLMFYHVNEGASSNMNSFFVPNYPLNPRMLHMGISWTFFD